MTSRNYDVILKVANATGFSTNNTVIGVTSLTVGYIAYVDAANNILKVKLADSQKEFSVSETIRSNVLTVVSTANGTLNTSSLPFQADIFNTAITTKTSTITSIAPSTFIAEKNAFTQNPIVRLYSIYYPGEWYPPNENGNPSGPGAGYAWPSIFPLRIAEIVGDFSQDISYNVSYGGTTYTPYPINISGLEQASDGRVNELSLSVYNVENLLSKLVEDPYLAGINRSNSVYAYVNSELVYGIDPKTVPTDTTYANAVATLALAGARNAGLAYSPESVAYYGKQYAPYDKIQTDLAGGVWQAQKSDTRDLLGAAVEIKTTFANFLDYWPEYSIVTDSYANTYSVRNSLPYRVRDVLSIGNISHCNAVINYIDTNNTITLSRAIVPNLYIGSSELNIRGLYLRPDTGSALFIVGTTSDTVYKYNMSTSLNVSTATLTESYSVNSKENTPTGLALSSNGRFMYLVGTQGANVLQYTLSTTYQPTTATYTSNLYLGTEDTSPQGIIFNASGSKFYFLGDATNKVYQYDMTTPWNIATATYTNSITVADTSPRDLFLNPAGTALFIVGTQKSSIFQYNLSQADDIASATLYANAYVGNYESIPSAMTMSKDGDQLWLTGASSDTIYQLSLANAWDITTLNNTPTLPAGVPLYIVNSQADAESYLQDVYKIDQLEGLSEQVASFSLVSWLQYFKIVTPKRKYYKNTCQWVYKGDECQYPGPGGGSIPGTTLSAPNSGFTASNASTDDFSKDICAKSLAACTLRNNSLHFGGFAGVGRTVPQM